MMTGLKDKVQRLTGERVSIGIDLTDEYVQISYFDNEGGISTLREGESLLIPAVLSKRLGEDIWFCGADALNEADNAVLIDSILSKAKKGDEVEADGMSYDPVDLLALLIKKCLSKLDGVCPLEKVGTVAFTVEEPDNATVSVLDAAIGIVRIKREQVAILSHAESAYHYMLSEPKALRFSDVVIFDLQNKGLKTIYLRQNMRTVPIVVLSEERMHSTFKKDDSRFKDIFEAIAGDNAISAIYLLGEGFNGEWFPETLKVMCRGRRAFLGTNLFSKGACIAAAEKSGAREADREHVFLGPDKIRANIGLNVIREGADSYMALLDAGKSWYESAKECDIMLPEDRTLELLVTPINGNSARTVRIELKDLPLRPARASRVHLEIHMVSEERVKLRISDLGFGELFRSSGCVTEAEFSVL
ncbi:MAG: hypothetical protein K5987_06065 [Lachnospiraceae bacterium]|nr:hypothetical protein [Lachnospiraceae bacterium]